VVEKLNCILNYFEMISKNSNFLHSLLVPTGNVTFKRQVVEDFPDWKNSTTKLCPLDILDEGSIEDSSPEYSQVDFANSFIGGGVIGNGCVQEEIRFIISPECIVSRLFMEELDKNEAIIITGSKRYSDFVGYSDTFEYRGSYNDMTPMDSKNRVDCEIVAIDAIDFSRILPEAQFRPSKIDRELNKAFTGFYCEDGLKSKKIATGLWGCGAFLGNKELKTIIQLMAASEAKRTGILFYTYGNPQFKKDLKQFYALMSILEITVGELYEWMLSKPEDKGLIAHIRDSIIKTSQEME
jgi:poly(ADP-ribose) glycohydrolase